MKKREVSFLFLFLLITSLVYAAEKGKVIAVASEGKTATAKVSGVAARSPYFLLFDGDDKLLEAVDNPYKATTRGAGTSVVNFLAQKGATFVAAGEFGGKMLQAMKSRGIGWLEFYGSAGEALKKVLEGGN